MAIPFYLPDEENSSNSEASPAQTTPSSPIPVPQHNHNHNNFNYSHLPQVPQIDNEALVQAFYEALCRCLQAQSPASNQTTPMSPSNPFTREYFWYPSPHHSTASSTFSSVASSPRNSFRERQRFDPFEINQSLNGDDNESINWEEIYHQHEEMGNFPHHLRKEPKNSRKKPKEAHKNKLTNFVISALQFVIDTLR